MCQPKLANANLHCFVARNSPGEISTIDKWLLRHVYELRATSHSPIYHEMFWVFEAV